MPFSPRPLRVALSLALALAAACSKHEGDGSRAVASPSLALTSLYSALEADGESRTLVEARVQGSNGLPRAHVRVTFETDAGTLLKYEEDRELLGDSPSSGEAYTNSKGIARAYLESSPTALSATVTARTEQLAAARTVLFVPGEPAEVEVHAAPDNLTAGTDSPASVAVWVFDANGNLTDTVLTVTPPENGSVDKLVAPTQRGTATLAYFAGDAPGEVALTVRAANGVTGVGQVTLISASVGSVGLVSDAPTLTANGGVAPGGRLTLAVNLFGPAGQPLAGVSPTVATTLGTLLAPGGQGVRVQAPPTDANGRTEVTLAAGTRAGTAAVTASAGGRSSSIQIPFTAGPPDHLRLRVSPVTIPADGRSTADLTVQVLDAFDNPTDAALTATAIGGGTVLPGSLVTVGGTGSFVYRAGNNAGPVVLRVETTEAIRAETTVTLVPAPGG